MHYGNDIGEKVLQQGSYMIHTVHVFDVFHEIHTPFPSYSHLEYLSILP